MSGVINGRELCRVCGRGVYVMCQRGTGLCGELCRKREAGELPARGAT